MPERIEETEVRAGLAKGGHILGAMIVARAEDSFVVYIRAIWGRGRGFRVLRTLRGLSGDRSFKNLHSAWLVIRQRFVGRVLIYPVGNPELRHYAGMAPVDRGGDRMPP